MALLHTGYASVFHTTVTVIETTEETQDICHLHEGYKEMMSGETG